LVTIPNKFNNNPQKEIHNDLEPVKTPQRHLWGTNITATTQYFTVNDNKHRTFPEYCVGSNLT
jgi:hypothetical protein